MLQCWRRLNPDTEPILHAHHIAFFRDFVASGFSRSMVGFFFVGCGMAITRRQRMQFERLVNECMRNIERQVAFYDSSRRLLDCINVEAMSACVCFAILRMCEADDAGKSSFKHFLEQRSGLDGFLSSLEEAGYITEDAGGWDCDCRELKKVAVAILNELTPLVECKPQRRKRG